MTAAWVIWYGLHIGLSYEETMDMRFGQLLDLIAIEQIKQEGCRRKLTREEEQDEFMTMLTRR